MDTKYHIKKSLADCNLVGRLNHCQSEKILILGHSGAGKTTLANNLSEATGITVIHLDEHLKRIKDSNAYEVYEELCRTEIFNLLQKEGPMIVEGVQLFRTTYLLSDYSTVLLETPLFESAIRHSKSKTRRQKNKLHALTLVLYRNYIKWGKLAKADALLSMYD